ncbi:MAG: hypothetical protein K9J17_09275 [Flavobacteriales bacterium]|nr:hypothetical protein [Flavobacteriales bacterium]
MLGLAVATIDLVGFSSGLTINYVLFVLLAVSGAFGMNQILKKSSSKFGYLVLSVFAAAFTYTVLPNIFVDDTGFVVRYMNMARKGCFYCYNVSDGPVFGISSFLYGLATISLAMADIASNSAIIIGLNFVGLTVVFYLLLSILQRKFQNHIITISSAVLVIMMSTRFLFSTTAGLETNFHLAIVFAGIYFFFSERRNWMWLFFGLSVVSKLDTVPLVTVLSLIHLYENRTDYFGSDWIASWRAGALYAGIPIALFVCASFALFDGPLPQSAYAKLYHHSHPSNHWFPFLELMMDKGARKALFGFSIFFPMLHVAVSLRNRTFRLIEIALFAGFWATMGLFYVYNPVERMVWYYAMPELLLYTQLLLSVVYLMRQFAKASEKLFLRSYMFMFAALSIASVPLTLGELDWMDRYLNTVETERLEIGEMIASFPATDTLVSAHGHFGANYQGYVLDMSGLNSKLVTDIKLNADSVLSIYKPKYFIHHASGQNVTTAENNGYVLKQEWTKIEEYDYPKWVLYERK